MKGMVRLQGSPERARSWAAREDWLAKDKFSEMLASAPYSVLLDCSSWKVSDSFPIKNISLTLHNSLPSLATLPYASQPAEE